MPADARRSEPKEWPLNLTLSSVMFFVAVPTLCYQVEYPRTRRVRRVWLAKRILELMTVALLMAFMVLQYWIPILSNVKFTQGRGVHNVSNSADGARGCAAGATLLLERVLKISVPVLYAWLLMFVGFFHLWFNVLAELTRRDVKLLKQHLVLLFQKSMNREKILPLIIEMDQMSLRLQLFDS